MKVHWHVVSSFPLYVNIYIYIFLLIHRLRTDISGGIYAYVTFEYADFSNISPIVYRDRFLQRRKKKKREKGHSGTNRMEKV